MNDHLLLYSRGLADHRLLIRLRNLDGAVSEVGIVYSQAGRCGTPVDRDALGMQRYILLHRRLDNEATNASRTAVYEPLADCQLLLSNRDDFLIAVSQSCSMRPARAGRSGGTAVRAKTKGGGALVDVNRVMPLQDFSNPIDVLVWNPDQPGCRWHRVSPRLLNLRHGGLLQLAARGPLPDLARRHGKRLVNRGTTRIRRFVVETPVEENVTLHSERVSIDRRPASAGARVEDADFTDRTIEVTETDEEAVVGKTTRVKEEVVVHKGATDRVETVRDTVRRQDVEIERDDSTNRPTGAPPMPPTTARPKT